jgi:ribosome maturation factor RimP
VRPSDFEDWAGYEVRIELKEPVDGRRRFRGRIEGFEAGEVRVEADLGEGGREVLGFPVGIVSDARLVVTDDLIREALARAKGRRTSGIGDGTPDPDIEVETD